MSYIQELEATYTDNYTVKPGDSLNKVALIHGVRIKDLTSVNQILNETIFPGQILKVPAIIKDPPSPDSQKQAAEKKTNQISSYIVDADSFDEHKI